MLCDLFINKVMIDADRQMIGIKIETMRIVTRDEL